MNLNYVNALCGAGKTISLIKYISNNTDSKKYLIVLPSISLIKEYKNKFTELNVDNVYYVYSDDSINNVTSNILDRIKRINLFNEGILVITQESFKNIPHFSLSQEWDVFCDEVMQVEDSIELSIPYNIDLLTSFISIDTNVPEINDEYYKIIACPIKTKPFLKREYDQVDNIVKPLLKRITKSYDAFIKKSQWNKMIIDNDITTSNNQTKIFNNQGLEENKLVFQLFINPIKLFSCFNSVTFLSANFGQTMLYEVFTKLYNVDFKSHQQLTKGLRIY